MIAEDRELLDIYLAGTPVTQLLHEVSCGDGGLAGVKVIVPTDRYSFFWTRIEAYLLQSRADGNAVKRFFASRCDRDFLSGYIARNPEFIPSLKVRSYLGVIPDVDVIVRLRTFALLPEEVRLQHVADIRTLAVETPDPDFLRDEIRPLFEAKEFADILEDVRLLLLPSLADHIDDWQASHDGEEDPESHFYLLETALTDYRNAMNSDSGAIELIDAGLSRIKESIEELRAELPASPDEESDYFRDASLDRAVESRSVFDDVDQ